MSVNIPKKSVSVGTAEEIYGVLTFWFVNVRDIVQSLQKNNCCRVGDFDWQMQLRYDYDPDEDNVTISQVTYYSSFDIFSSLPKISQVMQPLPDDSLVRLFAAALDNLGTTIIVPFPSGC